VKQNINNISPQCGKLPKILKKITLKVRLATLLEGWEISRKSSIWIFPGSWHNWLVLSSESPNIFHFVLFGIMRLQETFEKKKIKGREISSKYSIWIFPGTTSSFWVQSLQFFFVLSYLGFKDKTKTVWRL
jgi:hypothetical protein